MSKKYRENIALNPYIYNRVAEIILTRYPLNSIKYMKPYRSLQIPYRLRKTICNVLNHWRRRDYIEPYKPYR